MIIIGNEKWLAPASLRERRFAVFSVGDKRRQDRKFFGAMKDGLLKHGGASLLMSYFLNWDVNTIDINFAPQTEGLAVQKRLSLSAFDDWWLNCLTEGEILGSGIHEWPAEVKVHDFYEAHVRCLGTRAHIPKVNAIGMAFKHLSKKCAGSKSSNGVRKYHFCSLDEARAEWDEHAGFKTQWD